VKKKIALLSALGVAGGLLYALQSQHRRNKGVSKKDTSTGGSNGQPAAKAGQSGKKQASSAMNTENAGTNGEHGVDDHGTGQSEASQILRNIRDNAFEADDEKLALALGRPKEEIESWIGGNGLIDGDVVMKARTLAMQRGVEV
jgi:hypothetical protein